MMKTPRVEKLGQAQTSPQANTQLNNETYPGALSPTILNLQSALVRALYDGEGLDGLSHRIADYMHGCIVICDSNASPLSTEFPGDMDGEQIKLFRQYILSQSSRGQPDTGSIREAHYVSTDDTVRDARYAAVDPAWGTQNNPAVSTEIFNGSTICKLTVPLEYGGERACSLSVMRFSVPFSADALETVHYAAGLFCVQLAQDKKVADIELRLKGNFVEDLIASHYSDPESILNRARALDYNVLATHRVLVAEIENFQQIVHQLMHDQKAIISFKTDLVQSMQSRLNQSNKGMAIYSKDAFVLLVQQKKSGGDISDFKVLAEKIIEDVASQFSAKMFIGIGSAATELSDFSISYMAAKKALEIGDYMITEGQVRSFEQFKVHALFLSTLKPAELYNYARDQLEALLAYDEKHRTDFLKTLQEFLYLRNNVEGTAKTLNMSVSGLKYRLQKIEKIIGLNLKDYKVCFDLQLALVIMQLFGEYRIKEKN